MFKRPKSTARRSILTEEYPEIYRKCATPLLRIAAAHPDWLEPENRFVLYRPDDPLYIKYYYPDAEDVWTYDTPEGHFKVHYTESGVNAVFDSDGMQHTIPDYVISLGSYYEQARDHEINQLGYIPPAPDGTEGGDSRFDLYILDMDNYGYTEVEDGHPFIVVHNDYTGFESNLDPEGSRAGNMKVTAAHEFFHAIQYIYDDWNDYSIWWEENTAVWMEDEVFDYIDGYLNYLGNPYDDLNGNLRWDSREPWYNYDGTFGDLYGRKSNVWFEAPHISLDTETTSTFYRYEYGGVIWAKYLSARFGPDFIKDSFIICDYNTEALTALQKTFQLQDYNTNLQEVFSDFRVRVLTLEPEFFEEGSKYPLVRHYGNYGSYPVNLNLRDMSHLACLYIGLKAPDEEKRLVINIDGQDSSSFGVALVLFKDRGHELRYIQIDDHYKQTGEIEVISFGNKGMYKRATLIPLNLSTYQDFRQISIYAHLEDVFSYDIPLRKGMNIVSLPPNLAAAANSHDLLKNYFDPSDKVRFLGHAPDTGPWQVSYLWDNKPVGSLFDIDWQKGYILTVSQDSVIHLAGDTPYKTTIDLFPGHNIISTLISDLTSGQDSLSSREVLESTKTDRQISSSIQKYDSWAGKWLNGYWFFGRPSGMNFKIRKGEGYIIDMVEAHQGWSP